MKKQTKHAWGSIGVLIRPYLGAVIGLNVLTVFHSLAQVALAIVTKYVIDAAISGNGKLLEWGIGLAGVLLALLVSQLLSSWVAGNTTDHCVADMRKALLTAANNCTEPQLNAYHSGALLSRGMEDVHTVCDGFVLALPSITGQITRLVGAFGAIVLLYPRIAPLLLVACVCVVGMTAAVRPLMRRKHRLVREKDEQMMSTLQENLQQLELVQSLQMEQQSLHRFGQRVRSSLAERRNRRIVTVGVSGSLSLISQLGTGVLLIWGAVQVADHRISYGALTALLELLAMLRSPVVGLSGMWNRFAAIEVAAERLLELLDQQQKPVEPVDVDRVKAVVFEGVSFHYPGDETPVLEKFSARFPLDNWACLTGISGKGKSTVFKLILGLYAPQDGRVYLETDQDQIPCGRATRHLFSYVPQDYSLFSGTVLENLQMVDPDADENKCRDALGIAQADFVWDMSAGVQTVIRENNTGLSKGQLQRLAIARAVLMDRPILLLDECTSALDAQTEAKLLGALTALNKQAILVTHRTEALRDLDGITMVDMEKGALQTTENLR